MHYDGFWGDIKRGRRILDEYDFSEMIDSFFDGWIENEEDSNDKDPHDFLELVSSKDERIKDAFRCMGLSEIENYFKDRYGVIFKRDIIPVYTVIRSKTPRMHRKSKNCDSENPVF